MSSSSTLVTLRTDGSRTEVPTPGVDSLWVHGGNHAATGALIGALAGLVLGAVVTEQYCGSGVIACGDVPKGAVAGGVLFLPIGALVGMAIPKWQLRVP